MLTIFPHSDTRSPGRVEATGSDGRLGRGLFVVLVGLMLWTLSAGAGLAGTIRDDRTASLYTSLAAESEYDCAGMVSLGDGIGSGTLIASQYVLTAGHMVGDGATFTVNGVEYEATDYWQHPDWNLTDPNDATKVVAIDIGILRLSEPVSGVLPATLYEPSLGSELGMNGTMVGFGYSGTGLSGEILGTAGVKRAGQNRIDKSGSYWGWSSKLMLVDFDSPDGQSSTFGSSSPLDLEMGPAHGDSGCGMFVELAGQTYVAGVQSAMWYSDSADNASYGDGGIFVSVGDTIDWIDSIVPRNLPPLAVNDSYQVSEDQWLYAEEYGISPDVLANDSDPNGTAIGAVIGDGPQHGSLYFHSDGSFEYLAEQDYFGSDTFTYRAYDGQLYSEAATVTIDVTPVNDAPLALDDAYEIAYGDEFSASEGVLANDSDIEDDELRAVLRVLPENGSVELQADGTFVYRPDPLFSGEDSFAYLAYDGRMYSRLSTVSILVEPAPIPGDANRDGVVDAADAVSLAAHWLDTEVGWSDGDFNCDGIVDAVDAAILSANWQTAGGQASATVPEPHHLALFLGLLASGLLSGRRRLLKRSLL